MRSRAIRQITLPAVLGLVVSACSQPGIVQGAAPKQLAQAASITAHFNHRESARYRSPLDGGWRNGDNLERQLIEAIDAAQVECLMAVQELTLPGIARALIRAQTRGVRVKVILENNYSQPWSHLHASELNPRQRQRRERLLRLADRNGDGITDSDELLQGDAIALLQRSGVPLIDDTEDGSKGSGLMHHKFVIVDERDVLTGSANFTSSGMHGDAGAPRTRGNVNHQLQISDRAVASVFKTEFMRMWGDGPGGLKNSQFGRGKGEPNPERIDLGEAAITVLFPPHGRQHPHHGLRAIANELSKASHRIDIAVFVFSAQTLADTLQQRIKEGVSVRVLADPGFASRPFSEVLDLLGKALPDHRCLLERNNRPFSEPHERVGTPRLARGDKLHHKFAVIDNKTVITGSFNWSPSAAHTNDETLLVIHSPQLAKHFTREMDRLWRGAELGVTARMQRTLQLRREQCGSGLERG